jgi:Mg-chelatase subunit ChlD
MEVCVPEMPDMEAIALNVEAQKMEGKTKVVVTLKAQGVYAEEERAPLKLVVSADKSGSMAQGGKMEAMKDTIHAVVKHLNAKDELGVVTFDAGYTRLQELRPLDKDALASKISAIRVGSTTNLSGGLFAAMDMLKDTYGVVLLLTDGLPNEGLTSAEAILNTMEQLNVDAVVHTFGYGADHCVELLQSVAAATGGRYFYIDDRKENVRNSLAEALGVCLGSVASTIAQVVKVTLTMESGELGTMYTPHVGNVVHVGDMGYGDERNIVFDVFGETPVVAVDVTYVDVVTGYAGLCHTARLADAPEFNAVVEIQRLRLSVGQCISLVAEGGAGMGLINEVLADVDGNMERCAHPVLEKFKNDLEVCAYNVTAPSFERGVSAAVGRNYEQEMYLPTPSQLQWTRSLSQPTETDAVFTDVVLPMEIPELLRSPPPPPTLRRAPTRHASSDF